jgi:hypothetical protein
MAVSHETMIPRDVTRRRCWRVRRWICLVIIITVGLDLISVSSLHSLHPIGTGDIRRVKKDVEIAKRHGKGFIAGEFGFFSKVDDYAKFLKEIDSAGGDHLFWLDRFQFLMTL